MPHGPYRSVPALLKGVHEDETAVVVPHWLTLVVKAPWLRLTNHVLGHAGHLGLSLVACLVEGKSKHRTQ